MTTYAAPTVAGLLVGHPNEDELQATAWDAVERHVPTVAAVPNHFAAAEADHPVVLEWVADIIRDSVPGPAGLRCQIRGGRSLLLLGITGTGKSHQLWGALRGLAVSGCTGSVVAVKAADLYAQMRPRPGVDSEAVFARYATAGVLLLDDVGAAKGSDWVEEINYRLVDHRYEHGLRTMITSNVPVEGDRARGVRGFREQMGDRVTSRLREMCIRVVLDGPDRRSGVAR